MMGGTHFYMWFALCMISSAKSSDVPCPAFCECDTIFGLKEVDCGGLTAVPSGIPEDTNILDLSACNLSYIPVEPLMNLSSLQIFTFLEINKDEKNYNLTTLDLPNLYEIVVVGSPIYFVPQLLPNYITEMSLANIPLRTLESGSFQRYPYLDTLSLWSCQLTKLKSGAFDDIPSLSYIEFNENNLVDESFPPKLFGKNQVLQTLSLFSNQLSHVIPELPTSVTDIDYSSNTIIELQSRAFKSTPNLTSLTFQQNKITTIQDFAFDGLAQINTVDLSYNEIEKIFNNSFAGLTGLMQLHMTQNNISVIGKDAFHPLTSLQELSLDNNQIAKLEDFSFQHMSSLLDMDLSNNKLSKLTNNTFAGLDSLFDFDISYNLIDSIEPESFEPLKSIYNLRLIDNRLKTIESEVLECLPKGASVYLAGNPWDYDCHLRWLREAFDNASYVIQYPYTLACATPVKLAGKFLSDLKPSDFVCG